MQRQADTHPARPDPVPTAGQASERIDAMMRDLARCPPGPRRKALRDTAIRALLPLARRLARRFTGHGEDFDDLVQVASLGLTKAVDGFVPSRGHAFLSYAVPTIVGEMRRHLRDQVPAIRLPRPVQEARGPLFRTLEELEQRYGGVPPAVEQLAAHTGMSAALVRDTLRAVRECRVLSFDAPAGRREALSAPGHPCAVDRSIDHVVDVVALASALRQLTALERRILYLRFYREHTQQQIAEAVGLSQVQVSRALAYSCRRLRRILTAVPAERGRRLRLAHAVCGHPDTSDPEEAGMATGHLPVTVADAPGRSA